MREDTATLTETAAAGVRPAGAVSPPVRPVPATVRRLAPATRPAGARRRWLKWALLGLVAAAVVVTLVLAWMPEPVPVELGIVTRGPMEVTVDEDGRTRVKDRYIVSAPLAGTLARVALKAGDTVSAGQVVARVVPAAAPLLDPRSRVEAEGRLAAARAALRQADAAVERARAAREFAAREAERQQTLLRAGASSAQVADAAELASRMRAEELASATFGRRVAAADVEVARAALLRLEQPRGGGDGFVVRAPIEGTVLRVARESEGAVQPGEPLIELGDPRALEVVVDVLTANAVDIHPGAPARIERWGGDSALAAHVHRIEPSAFTRISALGVEEQRVNVILDLDGDAAGRAALGDGYRVEARIGVWRDDSVLQVPAGAVFRHGGEWAVYTADGGRARLRPVQLGRRNPSRAEIRGGLREGDAVVVYPGDNLSEGTRVEER